MHRYFCTFDLNFYTTGRLDTSTRPLYTKSKEIMPHAAGGAAGGTADGAAGGDAGGVAGPHEDDNTDGGRGGRIKAFDSKYFLPNSCLAHALSISGLVSMWELCFDGATSVPYACMGCVYFAGPESKKPLPALGGHCKP